MKAKRKRRLLEVLTVPQAAEKLGIAADTVRRHIENGTMVAFRAGVSAGWRIDAAEIAAFKKRRRIAPTNPAAGLGIDLTRLHATMLAEQLEPKGRILRLMRQGKNPHTPPRKGARRSPRRSA